MANKNLQKYYLYNSKEKKFINLVDRIINKIKTKTGNDLSSVDIIFDEMKPLASCDTKRKIIWINHKVINDPIDNQKCVIVHELAHFAALGEKHNYKFRETLYDFEEIIFGRIISI